MLVILCALTSYLVPETAWIRHVMRFQSQVLFRHDWSEADSLRPYLTHVAQIPRIPKYFYKPLHGFSEGGVCREQALQQSCSMRYIMHMFQCNPHYRETSYASILSTLQISDLAIDIGCGTGDSTQALFDNVPEDVRVYGVDLSRSMTKLAKRRTNLSYVTADAAFLPFANNSAGIITAFALFHEMPRSYSRKVIKECGRVIKSGGYLVIWDQNPELISPQASSSVPIEPFLESYKKMNITLEAQLAGFDSVYVKTNRFMRAWICKKK
tara:strand:- start:6281 stop:7084 length:804 start_codon:yes stop_codon:yes gene_type:complete